MLKGRFKMLITRSMVSWMGTIQVIARVSPKMAEDLQDLLLISGIYSYILKDGENYKIIITEDNMERFAQIIDDPRIEKTENPNKTSR